MSMNQAPFAGQQFPPQAPQAQVPAAPSGAQTAPRPLGGETVGEYMDRVGECGRFKSLLGSSLSEGELMQDFQAMIGYMDGDSKRAWISEFGPSQRAKASGFVQVTEKCLT